MRLKKEAEIEGGGVGVGGVGGEGGGDGEDGGVDTVVGGGKKVTFREQEWAVLGSDLSSVGGGGVLGHLGGKGGR